MAGHHSLLLAQLAPQPPQPLPPIPSSMFNPPMDG